jgi:hypothetical protein
MAQKVCRLLFIGLPRTGKTTFLAALWHQVDSSEIPEGLHLSELHGDREYLNKIRDSWLGCWEIDRTRVGGEEVVAMRLAEEGAPTIAELVIPDLSGETFRQQWEKRRWTKSYHQLTDHAEGALVFVHPEEVIEPARIDEAESLIVELKDHDVMETDGLHESWRPWTPDSAPTQVQVVDLLQFLSYHPGLKLPFKLAVIISAWDLVEQQHVSPAEWLTRRLPLLEQYLDANHELFPYRLYGISAQGGDLESETARLLERIPQSNRVIVVGTESRSHDITAPIKWLIREG